MALFLFLLPCSAALHLSPLVVHRRAAILYTPAAAPQDVTGAAQDDPLPFEVHGRGRTIVAAAPAVVALDALAFALKVGWRFGVQETAWGPIFSASLVHSVLRSECGTSLILSQKRKPPPRGSRK